MSEDRPNVLMIMCDQLRHDWLGYRGGPVDTPHIDALAARSRIFTQAVCSSPVCAPSRIALAAGIRPHRMGAMDNHAYLPLSQGTCYSQFRNHGYHVGCCGKLDLAKPDPYNGLGGNRPLTYAWGFTYPHECEGKMHAGRGDPPNGPYTDWLRRQDPALHRRFCEDARRRGGGTIKVLAPSVLPAECFEDVYIGRQSCRMLEAMPADFPWHFFVSFVGPHDPFDPPVEYYRLFQDAPMPPAIPCEGDGRPARYNRSGSTLPRAEQIAEARRLYSGYVKCLDDQVGRILEALDERGGRDSTFILFTSDHGEMLGDHGRWTKSCQYESALRIPLTIAGPGIEPGMSDALIELIDLNPTMLELAGVPIPPGLDARSAAPLLWGRTDAHREFTMATLTGHGCIRTRQWKAILGGDGEHELYHLAEDPGERCNVIADHPDVFATLRQSYAREWAGSPLAGSRPPAGPPARQGSDPSSIDRAGLRRS